MARDEDRMQQLWEWAFGNGKRGADERLNWADKRLETIESQQRTMHDTLKRLDEGERERAHEERASRRERRAFAWGVVVVLLVLSVGGIRFALYLSEQVHGITQLLGGP